MGASPTSLVVELGSTDFQGFLVDPNMDLAPDLALRAAMLVGVPLAFALNLDPGAVDQKVQRAVRTAIRNVHLQGLLAKRQRAEVGHGPVQADHAQQALDEPGRLPQRHAEQRFHGQAGLDGGIAVVGLPPTLAGRRGVPGHGGIKPDQTASRGV